MLVLTLQFKNLATDYSFALDNYFDRRWEGAGSPPLTIAGGHDAVLGRGAPVVAARPGAAGRARVAVRGRAEQRRLRGVRAGGDGRVVATNGEDAEVALVLFGVEPGGRPADRPAYRGLLWRVHVRRGTVPWRDKMRPACAVIGVEFTDADCATKTEQVRIDLVFREE